MPYPPPPWQLRGRLYASGWLTGRGLVVTAFAEYEPGGALAYSELLVAAPARAGWRPAATVRQIWVDSTASRDGGRDLWAIPKQLADFPSRCHARTEHGDIASASFRRVLTLPGRVPLRGYVKQPSAAGDVETPVAGSARVALARAEWDIASSGPLAWLRGGRPLGSIVLRDFRIRFGG